MPVSHLPGRFGPAFALGVILATVPGCQANGQEKLIRFGNSPEVVTKAWLERSRVTYRVLLEHPQTQTVDIRIEVDDVAKPHLDFMLPTWRPGRYIVLDFAGGVTGVVATDGDEHELPLSKLDKTTWRVTTGGAKTVHLQYQIYANELGTRTRHVDDSHAFLSGSSVFMMVKGRRNEPALVTVSAPDGWKISSGLDAVPDEPNALIAPSYDVLIDAPLEIGTHEVLTFEIDDVPYEIAIWGQGNYDRDKLVEDFKTLCAEQVEMWGDAPYSRYVFLLHVTSGAGGGTEHLNSTIMQTSRDSFHPESRFERFLGLVSHEFFHTWNVKALRPAGLVPYDFEKENYTPLLWVAEGSTSYYGPLLMVRAGLKKSKKYFKSLASSIQSYRRHPGRKVQSLDESSFDAWTKFNKPNSNSSNTTVSFYRKGSLASLVLDLEIRARSENAGSFDEVLRRMYRQFAVNGVGYTRDDLIATVNEVSGDDFSEFFDKYIAGTDELPFEEALAHAGLRLFKKPAKRDEDDDDEDDDEDGEDDENNEEIESPPERAYIGLRLSGSGGLARVSRVSADGPAFEAGIQVNDLIVAMDGRRLGSGDLDKRVERLEPGDRVKLTFLRRDMLRMIEVTLAARGDFSYKLERVDEPTELQKQIYESWLSEPWPEKKGKGEPTSRPATSSGGE